MNKVLLILFFAIYAFTSNASEIENCQFTLVVGFKPGGTSSIAAHQLAHAIGQRSGEQVIVLNRDGVNGRLAADYVLRQNDKCVLFLMSSTSVLRIPPDIGLKAVALVARFSYVIATGHNSPATLREYMEAAHQNARLRNFGTSGPGSFEQLVAERLFRSYGLKGEHIPYGGAAPVMNDLRGGHISMAVVPFIDFQGQKEGLNSVAQSGDGIDAFGWIGIYAPPSASSEDLNRYAEMFRATANTKETIEKLAISGFMVKWGPGSELAALHKSTYEEWKPELDRLGIKF